MGYVLIQAFREVLLGITGKDFTLVAASKAAMRGATILKASDNKTRQLNKHTLMAYSGEAGDTGSMSSELCVVTCRRV
jgi:20S proteasome alpha/beta subunit